MGDRKRASEVKRNNKSLLTKYETFHTRMFHGFASDEDFIANAAALAEDLLTAGVEGLNLETYYTAGYDSPFVIFNRTNEVWIMKN